MIEVYVVVKTELNTSIILGVFANIESAIKLIDSHYQKMIEYVNPNNQKSYFEKYDNGFVFKYLV